MTGADIVTVAVNHIGAVVFIVVAYVVVLFAVACFGEDIDK